MRPGFSIDNETCYGTDMFTEMRVAFNIQRAMATYRRSNGDAERAGPVGVRDVLECATVGGAACAGLLDKCGTLTPGKEADIVIIRTDDINLYPSNHAIGTVVAAADTRNVDTVIIGGRVRKLRGRMVGRQHGEVPAAGRRVAQLPVRAGRLHARHLLVDVATRRYLFNSLGGSEDPPLHTGSTRRVKTRRYMPVRHGGSEDPPLHTGSTRRV